MNPSRDLYWLATEPEFAARLKRVEGDGGSWAELVALANTRMDFVRTLRLDRSLQALFGAAPPVGISTLPIRLAVLGSATVSHLLPGIRVAALRRGIWLTTYEPDYGQYFQELSDPGSGLRQFAPTAILFAMDAGHLLRGVDPAQDRAAAEAALADIAAHLVRCWRLARDTFRCPLIQQTVLPIFPALLGGNEHRLPGSRHAMVTRLNVELRRLAETEAIDLLAIDDRVAVDGLALWHDRVLWHRAKLEIGPAQAPIYGELVARLLAAKQGRSFKCLVLDLDNTLWGGIIGDDGLEGVVLGQGSALGEAFSDFQGYVRDLAKRGILLAVCSKNDEAVALAPFERHPEMVLKRPDMAAFIANWNDKPANLREIARQLNIGLDALVFVDDNPFERELVRRELPMVAVPEIGDDPALYSATLAAAGYFESLGITEDDRARAGQYQANTQRQAMAASATDLPAYLRGLDMKLLWRRFDATGLSRIVQLINKTNQFNLTTRRYTEADIRAVWEDRSAFGLQFRLLDRFGDNGIIAIVIARPAGDGDLILDSWLMSCRVLGRQVENATLTVVAALARNLGAERLLGEYLPTAKNGMVYNHYEKLGFFPMEHASNGRRLDGLNLADYAAGELFMTIAEG